MKLKKQYIKILQKAFKVWSNKLDDYDLRYAMDEIYYAKSPAAAIQKFLSSEYGYDSSFNDCKTRRVPSDDKIEYNDGVVYKTGFRSCIEDNMEELERMNMIRKLPDDTMFYIQDRRNYVGNSVLWWGLNSGGYVTDPKKAMKVSKEYILKHAWRKTDIIWEATEVENNITSHVDAQYLNKKKSF